MLERKLTDLELELRLKFDFKIVATRIDTFQTSHLP